MLDAVENILSEAEKGRDAFDGERLIQTWIVHHLQIIGEAAGRIDDSFRRAHPEIPWARMAAMRNILVHEYFGVDLNEIWLAVERDIPPLKEQLQSLIRGVDSELAE